MGEKSRENLVKKLINLKIEFETIRLTYCFNTQQRILISVSLLLLNWLIIEIG